MTTTPTLQVVDIPVFNMLVPKEGPKVVPILVDLTAQQSSSIDMTILQQRSFISQIQAAWVDNSGNADSVKILCNGSNQAAVVPGGAQGQVLLFAPNPPKFTISSAGGVAIPIFFSNMPLPPAVWQANGAFPSFDSSGAMLVDEPTLRTIVSNGNANVIERFLGNNDTVISRHAGTQTNFFGNAVSTAGTYAVLTGAPSYVMNGFDIALTGDASVSGGGHISIELQDSNGPYGWCKKWVNLPSAAGSGNLIQVAAFSGLNFDAKVTSSQLQLVLSTTLATGLLMCTVWTDMTATAGP